MTTNAIQRYGRSMSMRVTIRSGKAEDAANLTGVALRSKAHWGYDAAFMDKCRPELTMTPGRFADEVVVVAENGNGAIVGFGSFVREPDGTAEIMNCFVEPVAIGMGVGRRIMAALLERAREEGIVTVSVDSDPQAEGFYRRAGFLRIGEAPSGSIPGRLLPRLRNELR